MYFARCWKIKKWIFLNCEIKKKIKKLLFLFSFFLDMQDSSTQSHLISFQDTVRFSAYYVLPTDEGEEKIEQDFYGEFELNGEVNFGVDSSGQYLNINDVKNMIVYDLEVYAVKGTQLC